MGSLLRDLSEAFPALRASTDEADRVAYARDLWPRHHMTVRAGQPAGSRPGAIVWPSSTEDIARLVRWANRRSVALVPFGAGSGVCAGVLPGEDAVVVDLKRLARIRAIDPTGPVVSVEAGHMGVPFEQALNRAGFTLGHFPSSILCSTVGGWVATRSAGQCSGAYGKIEDMIVALECVTGAGDVVVLRTRTTTPNLVPLVVGSEGTLAIVTGVTLRLHPVPTSRGFGAWSFPTTRHGWEAMRSMFQAGLRPAVARLYDPFDAMLAKRAGANEPTVRASESGGPIGRGRKSRVRAPGLGGAALRAVLRRPSTINELIHSRAAALALGGAMLVVIFEGTEDCPQRGIDEARRIAESARGSWEGDAPARRWLQHRYSVSYRQAPVFANGAFVDTMEVAARWSQLGTLFESVRRALAEHVFVMAHLSHAYPDGCCIYFSFVGAADPPSVRDLGWDAACATTYDRAWKAALAAAVDAGGTLSHHHGVGRSKAPRLRSELGAGTDVVRSLMRAFDPAGVLNPGNLVDSRASTATATATSTSTSTPTSTSTSTPTSTASSTSTPTPIVIDRESLLVCAAGAMHVATLERQLNDGGLTLDATFPPEVATVDDWLSGGAPSSRDRWQDPADQIVAGLDATLAGGRVLHIRPAPRRAVGPDLSALFVGAGGRFGRIDRAWLRVHPRGVERPTSTPFEHDRDPLPGDGERALLDAIERSLA